MLPPSERLFQIEDGLWQGARPELYPPEGIDVVINVADMPNDLVRGHGLFGVLHFPLVDNAFPGVEWLESVLGIIEACRSQGRTVLVHCDMGESRSSLVVVAYLMKYRGMPMTEALLYVQRRNPYADPNHRFLAGLEQYEAALRQR